MTNPDPLAEVLKGLRRDYLRDSVARVAELESLLADTDSGKPGSFDALRRALHKLAGSGGSYGLDDVSRHSRDGENAVKRIMAPAGNAGSGDLAVVRESVAAVAAAFLSARSADGDVAGG